MPEENAKYMAFIFAPAAAPTVKISVGNKYEDISFKQTLYTIIMCKFFLFFQF